MLSHNDYYRAHEEDVVSKLLIATRPSKQDPEVFNQLMNYRQKSTINIILQK